MTRTSIAAILSLAMTGQAAALSCVAPTVASSFSAADAADSAYALAVGEVTLLDGEAIPEQTGDPNDKQGYAVEAQFAGHMASLEGFDQPATFPVRVQVDCVSAWCGAPPEGEVLVFLERQDDAIVLVEGACPRFSFPATEEVKAAATACLNGDCPED
ncbi:MAG: hypothetical protein AAF390_06815 [Pseudomonadota bacterium]